MGGFFSQPAKKPVAAPAKKPVAAPAKKPKKPVGVPAKKSKFGAGGNGMLFLLLLLLVAGVIYYLHTQGKIKIPSFEQRMAAFGKTIKSLRGTH